MDKKLAGPQPSLQSGKTFSVHINIIIAITVSLLRVLKMFGTLNNGSVLVHLGTVVFVYLSHIFVFFGLVETLLL